MKSSFGSDRMLYLLLATMLVVAIWSGSELVGSRATAKLAAENSQVCKSLVHSIQASRARPTIAALRVHSEAELSRRIEEKAAAASLPTQSILRIEPGTPQRVGDTPYIEHTTDLEFREVTLRQLVTFLALLLSEETELEVSTLRLTAPRHRTNASTQREAWSAEVTLTYLIFSPKIRLGREKSVP